MQETRKPGIAERPAETFTEEMRSILERLDKAIEGTLGNQESVLHASVALSGVLGMPPMEVGPVPAVEEPGFSCQGPMGEILARADQMVQRLVAINCVANTYIREIANSTARIHRE
ncbi:MAG TPA: hypothetical protein VMX94_12015 [Armatimonadota bacterium]|nr:hypothetical protein [Armatimonadota bacterium]